MTADSPAVDLSAIPFRTADGGTATLADYPDTLLMIVNVASKCGLAPQYETLEALQREYGERGFQVLAFPCNQFLGQEPGSMEQILEYCSTTWGVSFPVFDKIRVNGANAAPLYKALKKTKNVEGTRGPVKWNFEKFILTPAGELHRFAPTTKPDSPQVLEVITSNLPR